jgi:hypothetical protein
MPVCGLPNIFIATPAKRWESIADKTMTASVHILSKFYALLLLPFDTLQSELLTASLNKPSSSSRTLNIAKDTYTGLTMLILLLRFYWLQR